MAKEIKINELPRDKTKEEKKKFYIDDYALTKQLFEEQDQFRKGEITRSSEDLASKFITILEHVLTKHNFSGYSRNYKDEFRSLAYEKFVKHWHKFDPTRARLNYYQLDGELFYKENKEELRGGFGWFSLFSSSSAIDVIKKMNAQRDKIKKIVDDKNAELEYLDAYVYQ